MFLTKNKIFFKKTWTCRKDKRHHSTQFLMLFRMRCSPPLYDVIWLQKVKNTDISFFFRNFEGYFNWNAYNSMKEGYRRLKKKCHQPSFSRIIEWNKKEGCSKKSCDDHSRDAHALSLKVVKSISKILLRVKHTDKKWHLSKWTESF